MLEHIEKSLSNSGIMQFSRLKASLTCLARMERLWFGEQRRQSLIHNVQLRL